jgi:hypothetical protein
MQVGKAYYFMVHAYHHFIAILDEVTGKQAGKVSHVIRIQSSQKDWNDFFSSGLGDDTTTVYKHFPDGSITWFAAFEWNHPIPKRPY